jgi:hypothetical protein
VRTRIYRLWLAAFLLSIFLTVQLAAAAYACAGSRYSMERMAVMAGMTESCPDMTQKAKAPAAHDGLCLEHCQFGSKSADHASPQIPSFQPVLVNFVEPALVPVLTIQRAAYADAVPRPPLAPFPFSTAVSETSRRSNAYSRALNHGVQGGRCFAEAICICFLPLRLGAS